jgi:hypothetical protein
MLLHNGKWTMASKVASSAEREPVGKAVLDGIKMLQGYVLIKRYLNLEANGSFWLHGSKHWL